MARRSKQKTPARSLVSMSKPAADFQYLAGDVIGLGEAEQHDAADGFIGGAGSAERRAFFDGLDHRPRQADPARHALDHHRSFASDLLGETRLDVAEGHAIHVD